MTIWALIACAIMLAIGFTAFTGAPYVPSRRPDVQRAFDELYELKKDDVLVDIGSGDGIVLRLASACGARAVGVEIHPFLVLVSRWLSRHDERVTTQLANFWHINLPSDTTVVYVFGDDRDMSKITKYLETQATKLGRPLCLISYGFEATGHKVVREVGAHRLYQIEPLHK